MSTDHRDLRQGYEHGEFVTHCACGHRSTGPDPDSADAAHEEHRYDEAIIYSKPDCPSCTATYRAFQSAGIPFRVIDLTADADALALVKALGYAAAPVVVMPGGDHWAGFRPDKIVQHKAA